MVSDCAVLVVGDAGRSPRIQYHVAALAEHYSNIDFIGNFETKCINEIDKNYNINKIHIGSNHIQNCFNLLYILLVVVKSKILLIQNTPAIPSLLIPMLLYPVLKYRGTTVIIDWHNLSYSIASYKYGNYHIYTLLLRIVEWWAAKIFPLHICVSDIFRTWLHTNYNIKPLTFYDKPYMSFQQIDKKEKKEILEKFIPYANDEDIDRAKIVITSTSWTPDERFDILWDVFEMLDKSFKDGCIHYYFIITGKGPLRQHYEKLLDSKPFDHIQVLILWLEHNVYSQILSCADVGICLHDSTSGLDIPMKVVDMLGCGIPVVAKNYKGILEVIEPEINGLLFSTEFELVSILKHNDISYWNDLKDNIRNKYQPTFKQNWNENMFQPISCCM